jgi:transposase
VAVFAFWRMSVRFRPVAGWANPNTDRDVERLLAVRRRPAARERPHPLVIRLTPGQAGDAPQAPALLAGLRRGRVKAVVADRGYDSDAIIRRVRGLRARVVIPPVRRRTHRRRYRRRRYKGRNVVERFWNRVKQHRRVATRYEKLDVCFLAFIHLASVMTVLRHP